MALTPEQEAGVIALLARQRKTISDLEAAIVAEGDMLLPSEKASSTKSLSVDNIKDYIQENLNLNSVANITTAAGNTILTNSSARHQNFTGATTQTCTLPDSTTMEEGDFFDVSNQSTGLIAVNYNGSSLASLVPTGAVIRFKLLDNGTSDGTWIIIRLAGASVFFRSFRNTSTQTIAPSTPTKIQLNGESFDSHGYFDSSTNYRFTPLVAGYYQINGCAMITGITGNRMECMIYKNGSPVAVGDSNPGSGDMRAAINDVVYLNGSTDYIELWVRHFSSDGNESLQNGSDTTYFSGFLII